MDINLIAPLFSGWDKGLVLSALHGCMGDIVADDEENPSAAMMVVGGFCFLAGVPNIELVRKIPAPIAASIIVPQSEEWSQLIEIVFSSEVERGLRYAIKKEDNIFDCKKLSEYAHFLDDKYEFKLIDKDMYELAMSESWSGDLCSQFEDAEDFLARGLGVVALDGGKLIAGASSYTVYNGGIEIEVDTKPEYRRKSLATACAARLILQCLERGLYPSWDAHDLRSAALAQKLGYHLDKPYTAFLFMDES